MTVRLLIGFAYFPEVIRRSWSNGDVFWPYLAVVRFDKMNPFECGPDLAGEKICRTFDQMQ